MFRIVRRSNNLRTSLRRNGWLIKVGATAFLSLEWAKDSSAEMTEQSCCLKQIDAGILNAPWV